MSSEQRIFKPESEAPQTKESSPFVMMRVGKIDSMDRSFDIEYWQRLGDSAIFRAAWELVELYYKNKEKNHDELEMNNDELRLQRTIESFQRKSS